MVISKLTHQKLIANDYQLSPTPFIRISSSVADVAEQALATRREGNNMIVLTKFFIGSLFNYNCCIKGVGDK